jgi:hypothetical protein
MVDIALGTAQLSACTAGDANGDGHITVDEILQAVNNALNNGCGPVVVPGCGNGVIDANEECDGGGTCLGGSNAGTPCTKEDDCQGTGVCKAGSKAERACDPTNLDACPGSSCQKCIPQGGDGCAANCTTETTVQMPLKPGELIDPTKVQPGTSGSTVWNAVLGPLGLTMVGVQNLVVGKERDGQIPVVINYSQINEIDVSGLSCACVRGIGDQTCGGTLFEADGTTLATDCTPGYIMGTCNDTTPTSCTISTQSTDCPVSGTCVGGICADCHTDDDCADKCVMHACDGKNPCTFVHGVGGTCSVTITKTCRQDSNCPSGETCVRTLNLSSGNISCVTGMKGTSMLMTEDSKRADGQEDPPQCDYTNSDTYVTGSTFPDCGSDPVVTLSDQNPAPVGAALVINSTAIGQFTGPCLGNPDRPDNFCTDQESWGTGRGIPNTLPAVSGPASAEITNIFLGGSTTDLAICRCPQDDFSCPAENCIGPLSVPGSPLSSCGQLLANPPTVSGLGLAGAFTALSNPTIGDEVITDVLQAGTWATLATSISATDTTLTLVDASSFPSSGDVSIARAGFASEEISYTGKSGNQLTGATRGIKGTTAAAHSAGAPVVW